VESLAAVDRAAWDSLDGSALEGFDYLSAVEAAGLPGFAFVYVLAEKDGRLIAGAPGFLTDYALETTLTSAGRRLAEAVRRVAPRALRLRLAALGSPCAEDVGLRLARDLGPDAHRAALDALLAAFDRAAGARGCWLLAIKDAPAGGAAGWRAAAAAAGYQATAGMPSAELAIDFPDLEAYLARLSPATRKDMRRKLRSLDHLRVEVRERLDGLEDRVIDLYRQTRARSDLQFEELTAGYFRGVLERLAGRASLVCYFEGEALVAANLLLHDNETLLDKFFCMDSVRGPALNLWFVSWFTNVRLCLERGLTRYQSGQGAYRDKLRLGSTTPPTDLYFRHRRPLVNRALRWAAPLFSEDPLRQGELA